MRLNQLDSDFHKYYFENWQFVYYTALKILKNREAAEDVTNDVFLSLYEYMLIRRPPIRKIRPFLAVSVKRRAFNYLRDNKRTIPVDTSFAQNDSFGMAENRVFTSNLLESLYRHNEKWFDIIEKYYILEMTIKEIAQEYGCSEQAIRNTLQRAKDYLRKEISIKK